MAEAAADAGQQHGDSDQEVILSNNDGLDSQDFIGEITRSVDEVRAGSTESPDHGTMDNRDDSRGPGDPDSGTEDWSEGSHVSETYELDDEDDEAGDDESRESAEDDDSAIDVHDDPGEDEDEYDTAAEDGDEYEDESGEDEDTGEEQVGDTLTAEDRKAIKKDPKLAKLARSLQSDYTKKRMEDAGARREVDAKAERFKGFEEELATPQGMANYLANVMKVRPDVAAAALVGAMTGEEAEDVLTEISLEHPKLVGKVNDRVEGLQGDEGAMRNHQLGIKLKMELQQVAIREQRLNQARTDGDRARIESSLERELRRVRIPKAEWEHVTGSLRRSLEGRVGKDGLIDFTEADVQRFVAERKAGIDRNYQRALRALRREGAVTGQKKAKKLASRNKNRRGGSAPRSRAPATARPRRTQTARKNESLGQAIQRELAAAGVGAD